MLFDALRYLVRRLKYRNLILKPLAIDESVDHDEPLVTRPLVSIIIPTRDKKELLEKCISSILSSTDYENYEIVVVDNASREKLTLEYFDWLKANGHRVIKFDFPFNFSAICNLGATQARGAYLCFLNNDTEIVNSGWLGNLIRHAQQPGVGVVGCWIENPGATISHVGISLGVGGLAGHPYSGESVHSEKLQRIAGRCYPVSAVTFACAVVSTSIYNNLEGLDENFMVGLNDVDFGVRISRAGLRSVVCSHTTIIHLESASRGSSWSFKGAKRAIREVLLFLTKWKSLQLRDEFFG